MYGQACIKISLKESHAVNPFGILLFSYHDAPSSMATQFTPVNYLPATNVNISVCTNSNTIHNADTANTTIASKNTVSNQANDQGWPTLAKVKLLERDIENRTGEVGENIVEMLFLDSAKTFPSIHSLSKSFMAYS